MIVYASCLTESVTTHQLPFLSGPEADGSCFTKKKQSRASEA